MNQIDTTVVKLKKCVDCGRSNVDAAGALVCIDCELELLRHMCAQLDGEVEQADEVASMKTRSRALRQIRREPQKAE